MPVSLSESAGRLRSRVSSLPATAAELRDRESSGKPLLFRSPAFLLDAAMLVLASAAALLSAPDAGVAINVFSFVVFGVLVLTVLTYMGLYRSSFALHFLEDARKIVGATAIVGMAMTFVGVLIFDDPDSADQAARAWLFASTYLIAARGAAHIVEVSRRRAGRAGLPTLIVGAGTVGREFAVRLADRPEFGLRPVAFLDDDPLEADSPSRIPVLGSGAGDDGRGYFGSGLEAVIREHQISHVVVSFSVKSHGAELDLVRRCQLMGVTVSVLPRLFEGVTDRLSLERIGGMPLISVHPTDPLGWQFAVKYAGDRVLAALAIALVSPILAAAAIATRISLGRPIIFKQLRVGLDGNEFWLYKFRTMRPPTGDEAAEEDLDDRLALGLAPGGIEGADRRTRVGAFLRSSSIDELPQLFNVLRGDMSLVGPRPERPTFARLFDEEVYRYADRHRVKSGITGWSQVQGLRGSTSITDRVEWDNYYIENRSFWLDLKILALTVPALLRGAGE